MPLPNLAKDKYGIGNPKVAAARKSIAENAAVAKKANSPLEIAKQTVLGLPKATLDVGKDIAKGAVEFGISAGEAPVRLGAAALGRNDIATAVLPKTKVPGLDALGEVESFPNRAARAVRDEGATPLQAIGKGTVDTIINDPLGVAIKPLAVVGGLAVKAGGGKALVETLSRIIKGGKGEVLKPAAEATARMDAEFEGKTLPERLAATGERKLPVFGDTTPRRIPVEGASKTERVPIANDYRQTQPDIQVGPKAKTEGPAISTDKPLPVKAPVGSRIAELSAADRKTVITDAKRLFGRGMDYKAAQEAALERFQTRSKGPDLTFHPEADTAAVPARAPRVGANRTPSGPLKTVAETPRAPRAEAPIGVPRETPTLEPVKTPKIEQPQPPTGPVSREIPVAATEERAASGLAKGVEAAAVEKKLTEGFEGLSGYDQINMKDQAERAGDLIRRDYSRAKRIALGLDKAPDGLKDFSVYVAVEKQAQKEGDVETLRRLATMSRLNEESSGAAQTLRILAERDPDSPVAAIAEVAKAREKGAAAKGLKNAAKEVKGEVAKAKASIARAPKEDWSSFVDSITC